VGDTIAAVRSFIHQNFFVSGELGDEDSLLDGGVVDSTGVLELVDFLESKLGVKVLDEEILPENLDSVARIASFVERKRGAGGSRAAG